LRQRKTLARGREAASGTVLVTAGDLPDIATAPPPEFDGPSGIWSPETLLIASIADCFILTFRGVARAAHFEWEKLEAHVEGTLERAEKVCLLANSLRGERRIETTVNVLAG
jgi:organic hydroperoxide reductase OsmC/OhrA